MDCMETSIVAEAICTSEGIMLVKIYLPIIAVLVSLISPISKRIE
jgi:hypothetical protein